MHDATSEVWVKKRGAAIQGLQRNNSYPFRLGGGGNGSRATANFEEGASGWTMAQRLTASGLGLTQEEVQLLPVETLPGEKATGVSEPAVGVRDVLARGHVSSAPLNPCNELHAG